MSIVLELLCTTLFFIHHDNDDEANQALINSQVEAAGRYSTEGKRLRARIERTEKELSGMVPYHKHFPEGFLAVLNSISTPDVALYLEKSCSFFPWWDAIDLQYCIDTIADGLEDTRWKKAPLRRAASWARERLAALQLATPSVGTTVPEVTPSLTHRQLVLLCLYRGQPITDLNCERVAKELKSNAPNVAVVLRKKWEKWGSALAVRSAIGTRTVTPLVKDMQWVITQLTDEQKKVADNDLRYIMREIN